MSDVLELAAAMDRHGIDRFRIWTCACGQKNRIDAIKVIALASRVKCGKCGEFLKAPDVGVKNGRD